MSQTLEQTFFQRCTDGQQAYEKCSASLIIREMQIKTTVRYHLHLLKELSSKKTTDNKCW